MSADVGATGRGGSGATPIVAWAGGVGEGGVEVKEGSLRTEVRVISSEASRSRITGKRRQARAASILLQAASSDSRRVWVQ